MPCHAREATIEHLDGLVEMYLAIKGFSNLQKGKSKPTSLNRLERELDLAG